MNHKLRIIILAFVGTLTIGSKAFATEDTNTGMVNAFENLFGVTQGKRRNHTTGFCFTGTLVPNNTDIHQYSVSPIFREVSTVLGRLSHKGGHNNRPDNKPGLHGLALQIKTPSGAEHRMSMNTEDFFPVSTPEEFLQVLKAKKAGKADVAKLVETIPEFANYKTHMEKKKKTVRPYEAMTFNSINAFYLINQNSDKTAIRWAFEPVGQQEIVEKQKKLFLEDNLQANLSNKIVAWDMIVTLSRPGDDVNNPAIEWTGERTQLSAARLYVTAVGNTDACNAINYDPLALSRGFAPSEDPTLLVRSPTYAISFGRRLSE